MENILNSHSVALALSVLNTETGSYLLLKKALDDYFGGRIVRIGKGEVAKSSMISQ